MDATKKTGLLEECVRKRQNKGINNVIDMVDAGRGGGMVTPSWVVGGGNNEDGNGWYQNGLSKWWGVWEVAMWFVLRFLRSKPWKISARQQFWRKRPKSTWGIYSFGTYTR